MNSYPSRWIIKPMIFDFCVYNKNIINIDYREDLMKLSKYMPTDKVLFLIRKMEYLLRDIQRNLNSKVLILEFIKSYAANEVYNV